VFITILIAFIWWRDVVRESLLGFHTSKLEFSFRVGILLFISSEVLFFFSFFWAFFDRSLSSSRDIGLVWPPCGVAPISAYSVPLLNTVILLSSGVTITWSHHALVNNNYSSSLFSLVITILLGFFFLYTQYLEYKEARFSMSDGIYGRTFFIRTGFHGVHVMVGSLILAYTSSLILKGLLSHNHHFTFEASAWYWHFVDVVWLFLFISVYWWGGL
jgi:cytochrome c oxidase subunit 3